MNRWYARRIRSVVTGLAVLAALLPAPPTANAKLLTGATGSSSQWGSGWLDLAPPVDFAKGDRLKLLVGGSASKILVRLLPKGAFPDSSAGILGVAVDVPKSRIVELVLLENRNQVVQISVHGGPNPWGRFPLGGGNEPATLESADRVTP
jgi:hypothetical protein